MLPIAPGLAGIGGVFGLELLALLLGQHGGARPDDEIRGFPAHQLGPETGALIENVVQIKADLARDRPAGAQIEALDLDESGIGIGDIPADDGVPARLECARTDRAASPR